MVEPPAPLEDIYDSVGLPLGKTTCIRVVRIRPSTTSDLLDPIACDFSILDVDTGRLVNQEDAQQSHESASKTLHNLQRVEYQALSYTWGNPTVDQVIELKGTPFRVRDNLWDFLYHAREKGFTKYLWIDALCINQSQVKERNHQVGMMGDIYSRADCVIVWLGRCTDEQRHRLEAFFNASTCSDPKLRLEAYKSHATTAFNFMHLPYWSRAWIVQEYYLARRKTIWYGDFRLAERDMRDVRKYFTHYEGIKDAPALNIWRAHEKLRTKNDELQGGKLQKFFQLLDLFEALKCADQRDRIFALLSLLTTEAREAICIDPDYSKSTLNLFLDITTTLTNVVTTIEYKRPRRKGMFQQSVVLAFYRLANILDPDFQNQSVQIAILDLRASVGTDLLNHNFAGFYHDCNKESETPGGIDEKGCLRCREKPFVTLGWDGTYQNFGTGPRFFSKPQWQEYTKALLASEIEQDRKLGARYLCDPKLKLWKGKHAVREWSAYIYSRNLCKQEGEDCYYL